MDDAYFGERTVTGKRDRGAGRKRSVLIAVRTSNRFHPIKAEPIHSN